MDGRDGGCEEIFLIAGEGDDVFDFVERHYGNISNLPSEIETMGVGNARCGILPS